MDEYWKPAALFSTEAIIYGRFENDRMISPTLPICAKIKDEPLTDVFTSEIMRVDMEGTENGSAVLNENWSRFFKSGGSAASSRMP